MLLVVLEGLLGEEARGIIAHCGEGAPDRTGAGSRLFRALENLLEGNVKKVLISVALWLPYLLMSTRVNVTYRSRIPA